MVLIDKIKVQELEEMSKTMQESIVNAVVDVNSRAIVVGADLCSDGELLLLESGSKQEDLWGISLWPTEYNTDGFIEFDSIINLRPRQKNYSRSVQNPEVRARIIEIVSEAVSL